MVYVTSKNNEQTKDLSPLLVIREKLSKIHIIDEEAYVEAIIKFIHIFEVNITDTRVQGRCLYSMHNLLMIIFLASIHSFNNASEFHLYAYQNYDFLEKLGLLKGKSFPSHDTFRRVLAIIDPKELKTSIIDELEIFFTRIEKELKLKQPTTHIVIDGTALRGTGRSKDSKIPKSNFQMLNVYNVTRALCVRSSIIDSKTNETPIAQDILKTLNLKKTIVSFDALHTQVKTAEIIHEKGGSYLFNVKDNQKLLKEDMVTSFEIGRKGRRITSLTLENKREFRFIKLSDSEKEDDFIGQNYYVEYINNKKEPLYFLTSAKDKTLIAETIIDRWKIENDFHRNKDMLLEEDYIRYTNQNIAANLTIFNNLILSFINITQDSFNTGEKHFPKKFVRKTLANDRDLPFKILSLLGVKKLTELLK